MDLGTKGCSVPHPGGACHSFIDPCNIFCVYYIVYIIYSIFSIYHIYNIYKVDIESHANCLTSFYAYKIFCIKYMLKLQKSNSTRGLGNPLKFRSRVLLETVLNKAE